MLWMPQMQNKLQIGGGSLLDNRESNWKGPLTVDNQPANPHFPKHLMDGPYLDLLGPIWTIKTFPKSLQYWNSGKKILLQIVSLYLEPPHAPVAYLQQDPIQSFREQEFYSSLWLCLAAFILDFPSQRCHYFEEILHSEVQNGGPWKQVKVLSPFGSQAWTTWTSGWGFFS